MGEMFALKAIEYVARYLPAAVKDGSDSEARGYVALANSLAAYFMLCTSEHSMEHALSAYHPDLPHGAGLIMLSMAWHGHFVKNHACDDLYIRMAKAMGKEDASRAEDFLDLLHQLQVDCGVENLKMSDYGVTKEELPSLVENARESMGKLFSMDPAALSDEDVLRIYEESYR